MYLFIVLNILLFFLNNTFPFTDCGPLLRREDPSGLKAIILSVQQQAAREKQKLNAKEKQKEEEKTNEEGKEIKKEEEKEEEEEEETSMNNNVDYIFFVLLLSFFVNYPICSSFFLSFFLSIKHYKNNKTWFVWLSKHIK